MVWFWFGFRFNGECGNYGVVLVLFWFCFVVVLFSARCSVNGSRGDGFEWFWLCFGFDGDGSVVFSDVY